MNPAPAPLDDTRTRLYREYGCEFHVMLKACPEINVCPPIGAVIIEEETAELIVDIVGVLRIVAVVVWGLTGLMVTELLLVEHVNRLSAALVKVPT